MLYSTAREEEELKQKIKILGGRQAGKAKGQLQTLYKGLPEGMDTKTYDEFRESGTDLPPGDWLERKDLKPGTITEWNTDMKISDKAKPTKTTGKLTAAKIAQGASAVAGILEGLDKVFAEGEILPGSGHTYSSGYNPEMYIGRTV